MTQWAFPARPSLNTAHLAKGGGVPPIAQGPGSSLGSGARNTAACRRVSPGWSITPPPQPFATRPTLLQNTTGNLRSGAPRCRFSPSGPGPTNRKQGRARAVRRDLFMLPVTQPQRRRGGCSSWERPHRAHSGSGWRGRWVPGLDRGQEPQTTVPPRKAYALLAHLLHAFARHRAGAWKSTL